MGGERSSEDEQRREQGRREERERRHDTSEEHLSLLAPNVACSARPKGSCQGDTSDVIDRSTAKRTTIGHSPAAFDTSKRADLPAKLVDLEFLENWTSTIYEGEHAGSYSSLSLRHSLLASTPLVFFQVHASPRPGHKGKVLPEHHSASLHSRRTYPRARLASWSFEPLTSQDLACTSMATSTLWRSDERRPSCAR